METPAKSLMASANVSALELSRYHDGNPGEALAGVGQRLGICYYCWERGDDLRQGICDECRAADSIGIEAEDAEKWPHPKAAVSYAFIRRETIQQLLQFLPEKIASNLDVGSLQKVPGDCICWDKDLGEISCDSPWSTAPLRIPAFRKPVQQSKRRGRAPVHPAWTPRSFTKGWNSFDYTFLDVRRLGSGAEQSHGLTTALVSKNVISSTAPTRGANCGRSSRS